MRNYEHFIIRPFKNMCRSSPIVEVGVSRTCQKPLTVALNIFVMLLEIDFIIPFEESMFQNFTRQMLQEMRNVPHFNLVVINYALNMSK